MPSSEIRRANCRSKMNKRKAIVGTRFLEIANQLPKGSPEFNYFDPISHGTPRNVFYFDREDVLAIFFPSVNIPEAQEGEPNYLMVTLGAHDKTTPDFMEGQPTTILMGVKAEKLTPTGEIDFASMRVVPVGSLEPNFKPDLNMDLEILGYEYPPSSGIDDVPPSV